MRRARKSLQRRKSLWYVVPSFSISAHHRSNALHFQLEPALLTPSHPFNFRAQIGRIGLCACCSLLRFAPGPLLCSGLPRHAAIRRGGQLQRTSPAPCSFPQLWTLV